MSEFFTTFMTIFMTIVSGFCAISVLIVIRGAKAKQKLKPAQYLSYKRGCFW